MPDNATPAKENEFAKFTNEQLIDMESALYDREVAGEDCWYERDKILWEMNHRGMCDD